jgi:hypothetical protein
MLKVKSRYGNEVRATETERMCPNTQWIMFGGCCPVKL